MRVCDLFVSSRGHWKGTIIAVLSLLHAALTVLNYSHVAGFLPGGRKPFLLDAELGFGFDLFWGLFSLPSLLALGWPN